MLPAAPPVRACIGVVSGKIADVIAALIMVAAAEKISIITAFTPRALAADMPLHIWDLMQAVTTPTTAAAHVLPGDVTLLITVAVVARLRWMTRFME